MSQYESDNTNSNRTEANRIYWKGVETRQSYPRSEPSRGSSFSFCGSSASDRTRPKRGWLSKAVEASGTRDVHRYCSEGGTAAG